MASGAETWQKLLVNAINQERDPSFRLSMDKETWQSKAVAFVAKERKKLVSYVRRLIDDDADRDGEDILYATLFMPIPLACHVSSGVSLLAKRGRALLRRQALPEIEIPCFSFLKVGCTVHHYFCPARSGSFFQSHSWNSFRLEHLQMS